MAHTLASLQALEKDALEALEQTSTLKELEDWRIAFIGRKGAIPVLLRTIKNLPVEERRDVGKRANELRSKLGKTYQQKASSLRALRQPAESEAISNSEGIASSSRRGGTPPAFAIAFAQGYGLHSKAMAGRRNDARMLGHLHPLTLTIRRIQDIFSAMGFLIVEGPEVEEARLNFDQLNIPFEHPARAETDTFYIKAQSARRIPLRQARLPDRQGYAGREVQKSGRVRYSSQPEQLVLRTHTSPVQLRAVLENNLTPPFRILSPGRVFRAERTDVTHETTFYQFEGLEVGSDITVAGFKGVIELFYSTFFGHSVESRLRPSYFPFVEPGFEVDISCVFCEGRGCRICKNSGWIEMMGAGMVHPNVLRNMNIDPAKHQGYAFGGAVDRLAMLRYGIDDIRLFWSGDIRFLQQFS